VDGLQSVYENSLLKAYGSYRSFVPEDILFLLGIIAILPSTETFILVFGDQVGEFVFLGAISHTIDRTGLPVGCLCMNANAFKAWMLPSGLQQPKTPVKEEFCFCQTSEFLHDSRTANQHVLLNNDEFKKALVQFIKYMVELKLAIGRASFDERYLGVATTLAANMNLNSTPNPSGKTNLTSAEKLALEIGGGPKRSGRIAGLANTSLGPSHKIPLGGINLPQVPKRRNLDDVPPEDPSENKHLDRQNNSTNRGRPSKNPKTPATRANLRPPPSPILPTPPSIPTVSSKLTKAQLLLKLNDLERRSISSDNNKSSSSPPTRKQTPTNAVDIQIKTDQRPPIHPIDQTEIRNAYRAQGKLDFEQAETYAKAFHSYGKSMLTDFMGFHTQIGQQ
jgi:hypothetical protein